MQGKRPFRYRQPQQKVEVPQIYAEDLHKNRSSIKKANIEDINKAEKAKSILLCWNGSD